MKKANKTNVKTGRQFILNEGIDKIEIELPDVGFRCILGDNDIRQKYDIVFYPDKYIMDFLDLEFMVEEIEGMDSTGEDMVLYILEWLKQYEPKKVIVNDFGGTHFPIKIFAEYGEV